MSLIQKIMRRTKAVSPVVAAILLIGLVVVAGAAIAFIVLPMLNPPFDASKIAYGAVEKTDASGIREVTFKITITNSHTAAVTVGFVEFIFNDNADQNVGGNEDGFVVTVTPSTVAAGGGIQVTVNIVWTGGEPTFDAADTWVSTTLSFAAGGTTVNKIYTFA